jgi:8-oxo-dGTP pyrophosphatase MutT (NUDIX family)
VPEQRHRASTVCVAEGQLLLVRLRDPATGGIGLYPPGGRIEPGEAPVETARRETLEETGLSVHVDGETEMVVQYPFSWDGVLRDVTTHWFRATLDEPFRPPPIVVDADYNLGALWLPIPDALDAMAIHPAIHDAVQRLL